MLRGRVVAALFAVQVCFGIHYLVAKLALAMVAPLAWAAVRIAGAALVLLAWQTLVRRHHWPPRAELGRLALYSIFGIVANQILFAEGLARTTASHSAILNSLIPVMTHGIAIAARQERGTPRRWAALAVAFASVLVLLRVERFRLDDALVVGDLLTLANGASFSLFLVLSRDAMRRLDPLAATACIIGFGAAGIVAIAAPALVAAPLAVLPLRFWVLAGFAILFATVATYVLNAWALARTDSSMVALFIYLQPPIATALSMVFLGERPGPRFFVAALGVFAGVALAVRGDPQPTVSGPSGLRPEKPAS